MIGSGVGWEGGLSTFAFADEEFELSNVADFLAALPKEDNWEIWESIEFGSFNWFWGTGGPT